MSESLESLKKSMALAELCLKLTYGEDTSYALSTAAEYAADDDYVLELLDNVVDTLRKLTGGAISTVIERLTPMLNALGLEGRVDISAITDAMKFFDALPSSSGDLPGRIEMYRKANSGTYTGIFRAIKLDVTREALNEIIAWRGISGNTEAVEEMLAYLRSLSEQDIEELGRANVNFLRSKEG